MKNSFALRRFAARTLFVATLVIAGGGLVTAGCALSRDGTMQQQCTAASECSVTDPACQTPVCNDGLCAVETLPDGELGSQTVGDCAVLSCTAGMSSLSPAAEDKPADEPCRTFSCNETTLVTTNKNPGAPCTLGGQTGICGGEGTCIIDCDFDSDCPTDPNEPCQDPFCNPDSGKCDFEPIDNASSPNEAQGDCKAHLCVNGEEMVQNNDTDTPDDGNDCTVDSCNSGTEEYVDVPARTGCTELGDPDAKLCDGNGACVECLDESLDCTHLPPSATCRTRSCSTSHECVQSFVPAGPTGSQTAGDCKTEECDGAGNLVQTNNDADKPNDNKECTADDCSNGNPVFTNLPTTQTCSAGFCDGTGSCVGCNNDSHCPSDTFCTDHSCHQQSNTCVQTAINVDSVVPGTNMTGDCTQTVCDSNGNPVAVADPSDPADDLNECTTDSCSGTTPVHTDKGTTATCSQGYCNGSGACVECNNAGQCTFTMGEDGICEHLECTTNMCSTVNDSTSTVAPSNEQTSYDCQTVYCDGAGDTAPPATDTGDVPVDGNECTDDVCDGSTPDNPPKSLGTNCSGGYCNGPPAKCVECTDDSHCTTVPATECDTSWWECREPLGSPCSNDGECVGGHCADGVCCDSACDGACEACGGGGSCQPHQAGTDPEMDCSVPADDGPDCGGSSACACGVDDEAPGGSTCPSVCVNCSGSNNHVCEIDCAFGGNPCQGATVTCPAGFDCVVTCDGNNACQNANIECPGDYSCEVTCSGNNACQDAAIDCVNGSAKSGTCAVDCQGSDSNICEALSLNCPDDACAMSCATTPGSFFATENDSCMVTNSGCY